LGSRSTHELGSGKEWLSQFPIKLHPPAEMSSTYVAKFVAEMPEEFERLKSLMHEEKDVGPVLRSFEQFLVRSGFAQNYDSLGVFSVLREIARS
jgi:hypothetical protein